MASPLVVALKHWRDVRGFSRGRLAALIGCSADELLRYESGLAVPPASVAAEADRVLRAGGAVIGALTPPASPDDQVPVRVLPEDDLIIERDHTELRYDGNTYHVRHERRVVNTGSRPLHAYAVRVSVDRYPGNAARSVRHHERHPLRMEALGFTASCDWRLVHDGDAYKEIDLDLGGVEPGDAAEVTFGYRVGAEAWGKWLQRVVRRPTEVLGVEIVLPAALSLTVRGMQLDDTAAALPATDPTCRRLGGSDVWSWEVIRPSVDAVYRFEWRPPGSHSSHDDADDYAEPLTARRTMRDAGIVQGDDPLLREHSAVFALPHEAARCRTVIDKAARALDRLALVHRFGHGQGIAAVQLGIPLAVAVIRLDGDLCLINPRVLSRSADQDTQYEGCLSFFDVRGRVPRAREITVEYQTLGGETIVRTFRDEVARLVAHEIDHLSGVLYTDRMEPGEPLVSLADYKGIRTVAGLRRSV